MRPGTSLGLLLLTATALAGCKDFFAPMPGDPVLTAPRPEWSRWYHRAEQCSGRAGDLSRVRWYSYAAAVVPRNAITQRNDAGAVTWPHQHKIAIAEPYLLDSVTVIHESLHDIRGTDGHPADWFGPHAPCAALIDAH